MKELVEILAEVEDFRKARGKRYELIVILAMTRLAIIYRYKSHGIMAK